MTGDSFFNCFNIDTPHNLNHFMKSKVPDFLTPPDAEQCKAIPPVICCLVNQLKVAPLELYFRVRKNFELVESLEGASKGSTNF